jgi:glutathione synthase
MNIVFLMDPLETIKPLKDTSYALMIAAKKKGHTVYFLGNGDIFFRDSSIHFDVTEVSPTENTNQPFIIGAAKCLHADEVDIVFIRTDPPFDERYLMNTWLLDHVPSSVLVLNSPHGLRTVNEKIWAAQFTDLIPNTLISRKKSHFYQFLERHHTIIAKPTNGFGGAGVFKVNKDDSNASVIFESLSQNGTQEVILQRFVTESSLGDKRVLLLNGKPLGALLRVHASGDHRNNFFSGGHPEPATLTPRDMDIIERLEPHLKKLGLYFVGIDIIGNYLIEVNVTSPTCIQEINRLESTHLEDQVIEFAVNLAKERQG